MGEGGIERKVYKLISMIVGKWTKKLTRSWGYFGKMTKCLNFLYMSENGGKKLTRS